ncbi:MAG: hypothetical protein QOH34_561, partial [Mycobacterium sp.]|nr:hypothetical protein [Mycobacterium sp.]
MRQNGADNFEDPTEVGVKHRFPLDVRHFLDRRHVHNALVRDKNVQTTEFRDHALDDALHLVGIAHVRHQAQRALRLSLDKANGLLQIGSRRQRVGYDVEVCGYVAHHDRRAL